MMARATPHPSWIPCVLTACAVLAAVAACGGGGGGGAAGPAVAAAHPTSDFAPGGARVTITGVGFAMGAASVSIGGTPAGDVVVHDDATITCTAPAGVAGPADVEVANDSGTGVLAGGFTYYAFPPRFPTGDRRVDLDAPASAWSGLPEMCCDGSDVHVIWYDSRNGQDDVFHNRSTDGGLTWGATSTRLDTDAPGAEDSHTPLICCDGAHVYAVWSESRHAARTVYANRSTDRGVTWLGADVRVDTDPPDTGSTYGGRMCCADARVYACYAASRTVPFTDVFFNASTDAGASWGPSEQRLDTDPPGAALSGSSDVCCDGANVYVVWEDARSGSRDIHFQRSTDGGATWQPADVRLDRDLPGTASSTSAHVCCAGERVYVVWQDRRNGNTDLYLNWSADSGATWQASDVRLDTDVAGAAESLKPRICCAGDRVCVTWVDERNGAQDIYFNASSDGGATWLATDVRLDSDVPGAAMSLYPEICCSGSNVFVVWEDRRDGTPDVYVRASHDGGLTWPTNEQRVDMDSAGLSTSWGQRVCCDGARVYVVWQDDREGTNKVYFASSSP